MGEDVGEQDRGEGGGRWTVDEGVRMGRKTHRSTTSPFSFSMLRELLCEVCLSGLD